MLRTNQDVLEAQRLYREVSARVALAAERYRVEQELTTTVVGLSTALGLLTRESALPRTVWRDPVGDFAGAKNDTISVRLPAYAPARTRVLRSGSARTRSSAWASTGSTTRRASATA